ncbi:MAG: chondroitinase family protein, partial [Lentisphaerota bacterium]
MKNTGKIFQLCIAILLAAISASTVGLAAEDSKSALPPPGIENFETESVPPGWTASDGAVINVGGERFKSGARSLLWSWDKDGATLTCSWPAGFNGIKELDPKKPVSLAFWIYNEKPLSGFDAKGGGPFDNVLRLELLGRDGELVGKSWYCLNFKGWRPLGAPYAQLGVKEGQIVTGFRLKAPHALGSGRFYLDYVNTRCTDRLLPDYQQPWVTYPALVAVHCPERLLPDYPTILATETPAKYIYSSSDISVNRPWLPAL